MLHFFKAGRSRDRVSIIFNIKPRCSYRSDGMCGEIDYSAVTWFEDGMRISSNWCCHRFGVSPPNRIEVGMEGLTADDAFGLTSQGIGIMWRGDFQRGRQLLQSISRRVERRFPLLKNQSQLNPQQSNHLSKTFHELRRARSLRARTLGMLLVQLEDDYKCPLPRSPNWHEACTLAFGAAPSGGVVMSLHELIGVVGAWQWRIKGISVPALEDKIHPHYGVFAPTRSEYVDLVASTPLPNSFAHGGGIAFDIGTGTGVLAAVLAQRPGVLRVVATDISSSALRCAHENINRLKLNERVEIVQTDLFPKGRASLVLCNPPWIPARPSSALELGVFDPESKMLYSFLSGLVSHLEPSGEGWLILSDLAEHLGLRSRHELLSVIESSGLKVLQKIDTRPQHKRANSTDDPLHVARCAEVTSLWRLAPR